MSHGRRVSGKFSEAKTHGLGIRFPLGAYSVDQIVTIVTGRRPTDKGKKTHHAQIQDSAAKNSLLAWSSGPTPHPPAEQSPLEVLELAVAKVSRDVRGAFTPTVLDAAAGSGIFWCSSPCDFTRLQTKGGQYPPSSPRCSEAIGSKTPVSRSQFGVITAGQGPDIIVA